MCNFSRVKHFITLIFFNEAKFVINRYAKTFVLFVLLYELMCSNTAFCESGLVFLTVTNLTWISLQFVPSNHAFFQFFLTYFRRKMGALSVTSLFLGERSFLVAILDIDEITVGKGAMVVSVWFSSLTLTSPALIVVTIVNGLVIIFCEFFAVSALFSCILNSVPFFG